MASPFFRMRRLQFSLGALLASLTIASVGFGIWWRLPWQIEHLPAELSVHRDGPSAVGMFYCGTTGEDLSAVWTEKVPYELRKNPDSGYNFEQKPVHAKSGKCWVRRDWQKPWVLDGRADVFDRDGKLIIEAHYRNGKLHGDFTCWFTDGAVREKGRFWHGLKDGVWEEYKFRLGTVSYHAEYARGQKVGTWSVDNAREFYEGGKIVRQVWPGENYERVVEFDSQERITHESYWQLHPRERTGFNYYRAAEYRGQIRHGDWERISTLDNEAPNAPKFRHYGSWADDLPNGEWVYELPGREPRRLKFAAGVLETIDGVATADLLMQKPAEFAEHHELAAILTMPGNRSFAGQSRAAALIDVLDSSLILQVDRRLDWSEENRQDFLAEQLPRNFNYSALPASACICLLLQEMGLAIDFRHHSLWLTTPQLAAEWRDATNTAPWFARIVNARPTITISASGEEESDYMDPNSMRSELFNSDWDELWEKGEVIEFRKPLQCVQGIARKFDPRHEGARKPLDLLDRSAEYFKLEELDQRIAYECESQQLRLKLVGDTLIFEPQPTN